MSEEIKPCPFCGGEPQFRSRPQSEDNGLGFIAFISCKCGGYSARAHIFGEGGGLDEATAQAISTWNTRAPVKVKQLEWEQLSESHHRANIIPFGNLCIESYGNGWESIWSIPGFCSTFKSGKFDTPEAAKAAVQEHFEKFIKGCLE